MVVELAWLKSLLQEIKVSWFSTLVVWCDNTSIGHLAFNVVFHSRTKNIEIDVYYIREQVVAKSLKVQYVPTQYQIINVLTKPLSIFRYQKLRRKLTV